MRYEMMFSGKERRGRKPRKSRTQKGVAEPSEKHPNLKRNTERQGLPTPNRHPRCRRSIHMVYASKSKVPRASVQRVSVAGDRTERIGDERDPFLRSFLDQRPGEKLQFLCLATTRRCSLRSLLSLACSERKTRFFRRSRRTHSPPRSADPRAAVEGGSR
uniref:Uncharacterized protein n=1 Tax=Toxoplasma gondii COUG TaxID=1074873 RepID=A0A2G8XNX6_TOXGO|nr:hypothetical protein TGCOUG_300300 [Toxoplasma gondii COUG]